MSGWLFLISDSYVVEIIGESESSLVNKVGASIETPEIVRNAIKPVRSAVMDLSIFW